MVSLVEVSKGGGFSPLAYALDLCDGLSLGLVV